MPQRDFISSTALPLQRTRLRLQTGTPQLGDGWKACGPGGGCMESMSDGTTRPGRRQPRSPLPRLGTRGWTRTLVAVIAGNLLYFSLERYLPPAGRHRPFHFDLGMLADLWTCIILYVLLGYLPWFRRGGTSRRHPL